MDELLRELLDNLDLVGETHTEIYDSDCRELMGEAIFHMFLHPDLNYTIPDNFGLYDDRANERVKSAIVQYVSSATELAIQTGIDSFHTRLAAFQNGDVVSRSGKNYYDDFFGWTNPQHFDEDGNIISGG